MRRLLVVGDDLGLTPGVNAGIASAYRDGILTSASLLANTPHFEETLALARDLPGLKVGIHLTLVAGGPLLPAAEIPSLIGRGGSFRQSWRQFLPAWIAGRVRVGEVRAEWRAQIARATEAGIRPAHLDSHQHLHLLPGLWRVALDLGREFGIPRIRTVREPGPVPAGTPLSRRLVRRILATLSNSPPAPPMHACDHCFGIARTGCLDLPALLGILRRLPEGDSELITHPGVPDEELLRDFPWGYRWAAETQALTSEEAKREVARLGIDLQRR
jgi:hopanoid biosynthesis associated protein HpnK